MKHFIAAFIIFLLLTFVNSFTINRQTKPILLTEVSNDNVAYRLFTSTNMLEMLVDHYENIQLILEPKLKSNMTQKLLTRFHCEDGDSNNFKWNSTEHNCRILTVEPKFDFYFDVGKNSSNPKNVTLKSLKPGKQQLVVYAKWENVSSTNKDQIDTLKAYITVNVGRSNTIILISNIIGWIYFVAWSFSFYPQIWENFKRKSVIGLNFDFVVLNITGFISYSIFNISLFAISSVQKQYDIMHPRSQIPVQTNDVVFAVHASFATFLYIVQCCLYERGTQSVSLFCKIFLGIIWSSYLLLGALVAATDFFNILEYLYMFSYVKLVITIIKYIPQAWFNYQRKSTIGWSIGNIFLDFTGGFLSMCQMFLLAHNYDDWLTIFNNFTKFGLGFISILFDVLFLLQHYVFYRHSNEVHDSQTFLVSGSLDGSINTNVSDIKLPTDRLYDSFTKKLPQYTFEKK